jgi:hypothetical protein
MFGFACSGDDANNQNNINNVNNQNNINNLNNVNNVNNQNNVNNRADTGEDVALDATTVIANAGPDRDVPHGIRVPLDGRGSSGGVITWRQIGGDPLTIESENDALTYVEIPATAGADAVFTFRLEIAGSDVMDDMTITTRDIVFENFLGGINDTQQLGSSEGIAFTNDRMWVVSTQGFVSSFDAGGNFDQRFTIPGTPVGANLDSTGRLVIANAANQTIEAMNLLDGNLVELEMGLGTANYPLVDANDNVFVSNRGGQQVWRYDAIQQAAQVFVENVGNNPNSIAFGPHADTLYIGTVGRIFKVAINGDGSAGAPEQYIDFGSNQGIGLEVDGLVFDEAGNAWFGCPNSAQLFVAPYAATGETNFTRNWSDVSANNSYFVNVSFGTTPFGETTLYYTNLGDRTVGRFDIGLGAWRD